MKDGIELYLVLILIGLLLGLLGFVTGMQISDNPVPKSCTYAKPMGSNGGTTYLLIQCNHVDAYKLLKEIN